MESLIEKLIESKSLPQFFSRLIILGVIGMLGASVYITNLKADVQSLGGDVEELKRDVKYLVNHLIEGKK